jgi:hypothetical protein
MVTNNLFSLEEGEGRGGTCETNTVHMYIMPHMLTVEVEKTLGLN